MTEITALIQCDGESVRVTPDRRTSVFDFIRVVGGQKNPRTTFDRLCKTHPEVVRLCDNWKFHGARQRDSLDDVSLVAINLSELVAAKKAAAARNFGEFGEPDPCHS
jgi:hypothetical protein